jgi:ERCC4-related helicase
MCNGHRKRQDAYVSIKLQVAFRNADIVLELLTERERNWRLAIRIRCAFLTNLVSEQNLLSKIVWFLAPTVTLCEQQYEVFKTNLPGYGIQLLSGKDNLDHWTEQSVWDAVLLNMRIVLSTHQVLHDALTHAFVKMSKLALLIFDEAHHCTLKHPAHRIMSHFYMPRIGCEQNELPKILGLSASPVMKAKATSEDLQ